MASDDRTTATTRRTPPAEPMRVLLITSSLGDGHVHAAHAVSHALQARGPACELRVLDFWELLDEQVAATVKASYLRLVRERPGLFDHLYGLDQQSWREILGSRTPPSRAILDALATLPPMDLQAAPPGSVTERPIDRLLLYLLSAAMAGKPPFRHGSNRLLRLALLRSAWHLLRRRMLRVLQTFRPHVIAATQMNGAALLPQALSAASPRFQLVAVPTDFGLHDFWVQPRVDVYCIPHASIEGIDHPGIRPGTIRVTGIPLMPGFASPPAQQDARRHLGLSSRRPVVLIGGGGLGLGVEETARRIGTHCPDVQMIVVTGRNIDARQRLSALAIRHPDSVRVLGWTSRMDYPIRAADVVIGKPGGLTLAEALACGRPLLATRSLLGQETFNSRFLTNNAVGYPVPEHELPGALRAMLSDSGRLRSISDRAWNLGRRDASRHIAEIIHQLHLRPRVASTQQGECA